MKSLTSNLIVLLVTCMLFGCGAKRTELGYGFYTIDSSGWHVVRRERNESGEVVDRIWLPDMLGDNTAQSWVSAVVGHRLLLTLYAYEPSMDKERINTRELFRDYLVATLEHHVLDMRDADLHTYQNYDDLVSMYGADDSICEYALSNIDMISIFGLAAPQE